MRTYSFERLLWLVFTCLATLFPASASACTCEIPPPAQALELSVATFAGEILDVRRIVVDLIEYDYATVRVENCWKGGLETGQEVHVWTEACNGCCTQWFPAGEHMVLFAQGESPHFLRTNFCYPNAPFGQWIVEALGLPGCPVGVEASTWSKTKRLYAQH